MQMMMTSTTDNQRRLESAQDNTKTKRTSNRYLSKLTVAETTAVVHEDTAKAAAARR